jgi:lysophospholipase L1-like esterase
MRDMPLDIGSFVALGDSFTEGVGDPYPDGTGHRGLSYRGLSYRGWADRFAERLAADRPDLRYANLAVRGRLVGQVVAEQVPQAVVMAPDLVSIAAGGNDLLRPRAWLAARRLDARWAREYAVPWFGRRLRGVSTGDGLAPKRPELLPL